jgi:hypothetical protein
VVSTCACQRDSHAFCFSHRSCRWEYFTTLWFEWEVLTKRRPWKPTMLIYFGSRLFCLGGVCSILAGFNLTSQFNCQAWLDSVYAFCYPSFMLNSLLILLRTIAIWERRPVMSIVLTAVWLTNVAFLIHGARLFAADSLQRFDPQVAP